MVLLLWRPVVAAARCSVTVLVSVRVLVDVVVDNSSATATRGTRRAVRMVGRCIFAGPEQRSNGSRGYKWRWRAEVETEAQGVRKKVQPQSPRSSHTMRCGFLVVTLADIYPSGKSVGGGEGFVVMV